MSLSYPDDRRYHPEHLWAQPRSDGSVLVGISDYAQDQLGAVIFVELPETGAHFTQGQSCASIESAKVTSDAVMPLSGTVLISVNDRDKAELEEVARGFASCGFKIIATEGTYNALTAAGIPAQRVAKINEGRPNVLDSITNGEVSIIVNTPLGKKGAVDDSYIRKAAIKGRIPYMTTMAAAKATVEGIRAANDPDTKGVKSLQEFHAAITDAE